MPIKLTIVRSFALVCVLTAFATMAASQQPAPQQASQQASPATATSPKTDQISPKRGSIKGRVVGDDGQPMANVPVFASPVGRSATRGPGRAGLPSQTTTEDNGNFELADLIPASYAISPTVPGYIVPLPEAGAPEAVEETVTGLYHVGDFANISLVKGGVITGKVINATGDPLTGVGVVAIRVGNVNGKADDQLVPQTFQGFGRNWRTDDRGIYRIYGLIPGSYIIQAGGRNGGGPAPLSPFSEDAPTYYPSSAREAAVAVSVQAGTEAANIDVRYRGEKGRIISGKILAKTGEDASGFNPTQIILTLAGSDDVVAVAAQPGRTANNGFALYGIPNGEYEITARRSAFNAIENDAVATPRRVSVQGTDVSGIQLALAPLSSLSGRIVIERKVSGVASICPSIRSSTIEEILLSPLREDTANQDSAVAGRFAARRSAPNAAGEFFLRNLEAGRWRVSSQLPDENWYVRIIESKAPTTAIRKTAAQSALPVTNVVRNGFTLKPGEKLMGVTMAIADGAATIRGKIVNEQGNKPAGQLRVHLIPAEKESAEDLLRYAQMDVANDGKFYFKNLAPGRYYLLAKPVKATDGKEENHFSPARLIAWDHAQRAALRKEAEVTGKIVELQPCQRLRDQELKLK